jgi:hypothetical protein
MSLAAVKEIKADCVNEYLLADNGARLRADDGRLLTTGRHWLLAGDHRIVLPEGTQPILAKLGLLPTECR